MRSCQQPVALPSQLGGVRTTHRIRDFYNREGSLRAVTLTPQGAEQVQRPRFYSYHPILTEFSQLSIKQNKNNCLNRVHTHTHTHIVLRQVFLFSPVLDKACETQRSWATSLRSQGSKSGAGVWAQ